MQTNAPELPRGWKKIVSRESRGYVAQENMWFSDFAKFLKWCKFASSEGLPKARELSASGGKAPAPTPGALPLDPTGGSAERAFSLRGASPHFPPPGALPLGLCPCPQYRLSYRLSLRALAMASASPQLKFPGAATGDLVTFGHVSY